MSSSLMLAASNPLEHVVQHPYVQQTVQGLPGGTLTLFSNQILMQVVAAALLVLIVPWAIRHRGGNDEVGRLVPRGIGNFFEGICQFIRTQVAQPAMGVHADRFIGYLWTVFFFILFCNLLGLIPLNSFFGNKVIVAGTATGNVWVTATLAVLTLVMIVVNGLRIGGMAFIAHFCPGPIVLAPLLVPVEIIGMVAKIFALTVRLFANMIAGHILLAVLLSFIGMAGKAMGFWGGIAIAIPVVVGSVAINLLELFVAFLQAFIFTFLTALFIGQAVNVHHEHHEEHGEHAAHGAEHAGT